ncbi:NUDIX domain-containing protein [Angustibacter luteus]|uniref:NUDIX domain-containing protein n=1 Tax=Angustibacter luteus TaxID=658456 RepID=A0ABW1JDQ9_9ACTN
MVARTPIAVAALVRDGLVLLVHRHPLRRWYPDCWDLVGGHIEPGESPRQAVTRECLEELGVYVEDPRPLPLTFSDPTLDMHAFLVTRWEGEPVNAAPEEHDDLRWFRPGELEDLKTAHPGSVPSLICALQGATDQPGERSGRGPAVGGPSYAERVAEGEFVDRDLRGARFIECDLSDVVMRGVDIAGMDIDAPWLHVGPGLRVNGVDVAPLVEQELDRRFPGRSERRAESSAGLRAAWTSVDQAWATAIERATTLPAGSVDARIDDEWSFAETLRHLVHGIDLWLGKAVLGREEADFHPLGLGYGSKASEAVPYGDIVAARANRAAMVRDFLATVTDEVLDEERRNPHNPAKTETVRHCLHVILGEGWEHLRFALRDLDAIEHPPARTSTS